MTEDGCKRSAFSPAMAEHSANGNRGKNERCPPAPLWVYGMQETEDRGLMTEGKQEKTHPALAAKATLAE